MAKLLDPTQLFGASHFWVAPNSFTVIVMDRKMSIRKHEKSSDSWQTLLLWSEQTIAPLLLREYIQDIKILSIYVYFLKLSLCCVVFHTSVNWICPKYVTLMETFPNSSSLRLAVVLRGTVAGDEIFQFFFCLMICLVIFHIFIIARHNYICHH